VPALITPDDLGAYEEARRGFNLYADKRPAAVAFPESEKEVVDIVRYAPEAGLRVNVQGTGHNQMALPEELGDTIVVRTDRLRGVHIDPVARVARVRAGDRWGDVVAIAAGYRLAPQSGTSSTVGVVGYTLGGGLPVALGRKYGLAANNVLAIELVTADGELRRVDHQTDPDLFWALRGGGGSFGAVTAIELPLYEIPEVYCGWLAFPLERADDALEGWRRLTETAPPELSLTGRLLAIPPLPEMPEPLRGKAFAIAQVAYVGAEAEGAELIQPVRDLGPTFDTVVPGGPEALSRLHQDPPDPVPTVSSHMLVDALPAEAIPAIVAASGVGPGQPLLSLEFRHAGAALADAPTHGGARSTLEGEYVMFAATLATSPATVAAARAHYRVLRAALAPWDTGRAYLNLVEEKTDVAALFASDATHDRLREIKARYDPGNVFRANHEITPGRVA
jgi:FAD/FMN-containing dehydrogenase